MKLNYMYQVLFTIYGRKCTISDPDNFVEKIKALEKTDRKNELRRIMSSSSMFSLYSKSQKTGKSARSANESQSSEEDEEDADCVTMTTSGMGPNPIILALTDFFDELTE